MKLIAFVRGDSSLLPSEKRLREIILYFIFGGLTTLVNLASFIGFDKVFSSQSIPVSLFGMRFDLLDVINTTIAWILAVLFAFVTNRAFVFCSKGPFWREMFSFFSSRILTLIVFEIGFLELGILIVEQLIGQSKDAVLLNVGSFSVTNLYVVKILIAFFVVVGNYVLSKLFVFRDPKKSAVPEEESPADKKES